LIKQEILPSIFVQLVRTFSCYDAENSFKHFECWQRFVGAEWLNNKIRNSSYC